MASNTLLNDPHDDDWRQYAVNMLKNHIIFIQHIFNIKMFKDYLLGLVLK